ncbi:MAG: transposase zinc-binding domain-containing protein [Planctomycetes bacterium]|nr:transposase zinc-binding domain-containing protein [Planctomycetota bacterium]
MPRFVRRELRRYVDCGILAFGFARVYCSDCGKEELVAFSCKGRGFCPSCCGRRMADSAAHLCDDVLPQVPVRQWVLSLPFRIRYLLAYDARLCSAVRRILVRTLLDWLRERAASSGVSGGRSGAVVLAQRFGGALNLNLHFHTLVLDGVFTRPEKFGRPVFHENGSPDGRGRRGGQQGSAPAHPALPARGGCRAGTKSRPGRTRRAVVRAAVRGVGAGSRGAGGRRAGRVWSAGPAA